MWYSFMQRKKKFKTGTKANRITPNGHWLLTNSNEVIHNGIVIARKANLVFHVRSNKEKTPWLLKEYHVPVANETLKLVKDGEELIEWVLCKVHKGRRCGKRRAKKQNCPRQRTSIGKRSAKKQNSSTQRAKRRRQLANTTTESLIYDISQLVKEDIPELAKEIQSNGRDKMGDTHEVDAKEEIEDAEIEELILDCYRELSSSTLEMQVDAMDGLICAYGTELSSNNSDDLDLPVLTQLEEENQGDGIVETDLPA
ncbi:NAC domain-containing protein 35-like [Amborella trichopoda]|uniref:NAC domain-containing protein 35-like n=1 Tax=Amborella trichopoda TaxID=13333 RepID=UPI0009C00A92|nr:NAC domain-containing protein 35-like [Amborella trichopoda]|eukprot:XP_020526680.1 NAC domain-containing protein 35-like [Amborella trichopoda]